MGKIAKNYIYNLIYQIIVLLVPLITAPYLARVLGPGGTGAYSYVNSIATLICNIVMLGIFSYGNRQIAYVRDDPQKLNDTFWQIMSARLIIGIIGTGIYFIVVIIINRYVFLLILYYTYILGYFVDCTWLFVGVEDMKWAVLKNIMIKLIAVIGIFGFVRNENDVAVYVLFQGGSVLIGNLLAYTQLKRYVHKPRIEMTHWKKDLISSALLYLPSVASTFYLQCDKIMIELITGDTTQVSFYDYSEKIITIPLSFITVLSTVMMPRIANEFKKEHQEQISLLLNKSAKISIFFACPLMFGMISIADKLIPWYLGESFKPTIIAIISMAPIILTNTLSGISGNQYFTATNQIGILLKAQIFAALGNVLLNMLLIPKLGFIGASIATVFSGTLCSGVQYFFLIRQIRLPGFKISFIKYFSISVIMCVAIRLISKNMSATPITNLIQIITGIAVYFLLCFLLKDKCLKELIHMAVNIIKPKSNYHV